MQTIKFSTNQRPFLIMYYDFQECGLLDCYEKIVYMALKKFTNKNGECFPSVNTLVKLTHFSRSTVQKLLKSLEEKGVVTIRRRKRANGGYTSNFYIVHDNPEMWEASSLDELKEAATRENKTADKLAEREEESMHVPGIQQDNEVQEEPAGIDIPVKEEPATTDIPIKEELPAIDIPVQEEPAATDIPVQDECQPEPELEPELPAPEPELPVQSAPAASTSSARNVSPKKKHVPGNDAPDKQGHVERYPMDYLKKRFNYDGICEGREEDEIKIVDAFFQYLYDTTNCTKISIRVNGTGLKCNAVISTLLKMDSADIEYAIDKYINYAANVRNQRAYAITILYNARAQRAMETGNTGQSGAYKETGNENYNRPNVTKQFTNQFTNYSQRQVTDEEMDGLEQKLLRISMDKWNNRQE